MAPPKPPFNIAIIGGGIAGLTFCVALRNSNVSITLYESANAFGEIGAGVAFGPNAARAMSLIDPAIRAAFDRVGTFNQWESKQGTWFDFRRGVARKGDHPDESQGELIYSLKATKGGAAVHRADFLEEMVKLVPGDVAKFGKRLKYIDEVEEGVRLRFEDGSEAVHSAVVGADGIKSRTREIVLGDDDPAARAVFSGKYAYRGLIPMAKAAKLLGDELARNSQMYLGHGGHIVTFPIQKGATMNVVAFSSTPTWIHKHWVIPTTKQFLFSDFPNWSTHIQSLLSQIQTPDIWALFHHPPARTYTRSRIVLIGDAAHASTPHQGAGAGMAIEDAYILGTLLAGITDATHLPAAFRAYEHVRLPRTQKLVRTSWEAGLLYDFELDGVGHDEARLKANLQERMAWIWNWDLDQDVADAKAFFKDEVRRRKS